MAKSAATLTVLQCSLTSPRNWETRACGCQLTNLSDVISNIIRLTREMSLDHRLGVAVEQGLHQVCDSQQLH